MRTLRLFALSAAALCFHAADNPGLGNAPAVGSLPPLWSGRFVRTSDGAIVTAGRYTEDGDLVRGMFPADEASSAPYVITKTGMREPVNIGDYVITESDGEHYYTYPPDKFDAEYSAAPLDTSSPADLPAGSDVPQGAAPAPVAGDALPSNTLYAQHPDGTQTPVGITPGSDPQVIPAAAITAAAPVPAAPPATSANPAPDTTLPLPEQPREQSVEELRAWNNTATDAIREVDVYLHSVNPELPEHYGMPVEGVRATVEYIEAKATTPTPKPAAAPQSSATGAVSNLWSPGIHQPTSPNAPSAHEAAHAMSFILENHPKLYGALTEPAKIASDANHFTAEVKAKLKAAIAIVERRFKSF